MDATLEVLKPNREGWWYDLRCADMSIMPDHPFPSRASAIRQARKLAARLGLRVLEAYVTIPFCAAG